MTTPVRLDRTRTGREELTALVNAGAAQLTSAWSILHGSQQTLLARLERVHGGRAVGATHALRTALADFHADVGEFDRRARAFTERWAAQDLPLAYRDGALRALELAAADPRLFTWSTDHQAAITVLSAPYWADLVRRITEAVRRAQAFARAARDAARQTAGVDAAALIEAHPLDTVVYRNQAKHPVRSWATAALGYQATLTANTAAVNTGRFDLDAQWFECVDGDECGFRGHEDTDHADGTIRSAEDAATVPLSHFGCIRQWIPRPDLTDMPGLISGDSI